jgi:plastocyanin
MLHRKARSRLLASLALVAVGAFAAGCGDDDDKTDQPAATTPAAPTAFAITATAEGKKKKSLEFPATVEAGLVTMTLTNSDTVPRSAQIVRIVGDQSVDDTMKVINAEETKIPVWIEDGGGLSAVKPGASGSATQVLAPGRYVIWDDEGGDDGPGHDELGAKGEFTVTGTASDAELPAQPATVTATDDAPSGAEEAESYGFEFANLKAGSNQIRFENTGEQLHHALFFPIVGKTTIEEVEKVFSSEEEPEGPPPVDFENGVGTSVIDGGIAQNITLELKAGRYAVICFISDREGGKPHVAKGMIDELVVE